MVPRMPDMDLIKVKTVEFLSWAKVSIKRHVEPVKILTAVKITLY
jgi:hypothetical protein